MKGSLRDLDPGCKILALECSVSWFSMDLAASIESHSESMLGMSEPQTSSACPTAAVSSVGTLEAGSSS